MTDLKMKDLNARHENIAPK